MVKLMMLEKKAAQANAVIETQVNSSHIFFQILTTAINDIHLGTRAKCQARDNSTARAATQGKYVYDPDVIVSELIISFV